MKGYRKLKLSYGGLSNTNALSTLKKLISTQLRFEEGEVNLEGLGGLDNLQRLSMRGNEFSNLNSMPAIKTLTELDISLCQKLEDINGISTLSNLEGLDIRDCDSIKNISVIKKLPNLKWVDIGVRLEPEAVINIFRDMGRL